MADEIDTAATPQGTEPEPTAEPEATPEPTPDPTPEPTPEPVVPPPPTPEEIEERAFQRTASWMGRREKELSDSILRNVTQVLDSRLSQMHPAPAMPSTDPATMLENPDQWLEKSLPRVIDKFTSERTRAAQTYDAELVRQSANILESNAMFLGPKGQPNDLGNEVVQEILKKAGTVDRGLHPNIAARLLVSESYAEVAAKHAAIKTNALAGNRPATGIGTIKAPGGPVAGKPAPVKLDDMAKKVAGWFGNSEEQVREFLK